MKKTTNTLLVTGLAGLSVAAILSGCVVTPYGGGVAVVGPPPPAVEVTVYPDDYWWDGFEYVGIIGSGYYYLGPGNVWVVCEPFRVERFHEWQRGHPDWNAHPTHNELYRGGGNHGRAVGRGRGRDER